MSTKTSNALKWLSFAVGAGLLLSGYALPALIIFVVVGVFWAFGLI